MNYFEVIKKRRSVRQFLNEPVSDDIITQAIDAALVAPNSSNLQAWEFYWIKSESSKKKVTELCLNQSAARTAQHFVVAVSRVDTWKRNKTHLVEQLKAHAKLNSQQEVYYNKLIPLIYSNDPLGILGFIRWIIFNLIGFFRPMFRQPTFKSSLFEVVTKSVALACENLMLAITAQGYASCPMEGFDECRLKKFLNLNRHCHIVMVIGIGKEDPQGFHIPQIRVPKEWVVKVV